MGDDIGPLPAERTGDGSTDALRRAGHQDRLAREIEHDASFNQGRDDNS
jgi:hypothetical protein